MTFAVPLEDLKPVLSYILAYKVKNVLEFGPGDSTEYFLAHAADVVIHSCEDNKQFAASARAKFKDVVRAFIYEYENTPAISIPELDNSKFDMGFVDGPYGGRYRVRLPAMEECSRLNTIRYALERCPTVFVHDTKRPAEQAAIAQIQRECGDKLEVLNVSSVLGLTRLRWIR